MDTNGSGIKCAIVFIEAAAFGNQDVADPFILMRHESGVHRVQRVPKTDPHHRIHTSTATVAVLLAAGGEMEELQLRESELRIDQYKSSGPGGQHVNKTNSAIRVVHLPTGMAVAVQSERCAVANKKSALRILKARLQEMEHNRLSASVSADRRRQVGSAERSEKIRTYNWPQARVTDHRTGHTFNNPEIFMNDPHNNLRAIATELDLRERQKYFDQIS